MRHVSDSADARRHLCPRIAIWTGDCSVCPSTCLRSMCVWACNGRSDIGSSSPPLSSPYNRQVVRSSASSSRPVCPSLSPRPGLHRPLVHRPRSASSTTLSHRHRTGSSLAASERISASSPTASARIMSTSRSCRCGRVGWRCRVSSCQPCRQADRPRSRPFTRTPPRPSRLCPSRLERRSWSISMLHRPSWRRPERGRWRGAGAPLAQRSSCRRQNVLLYTVEHCRRRGQANREKLARVDPFGA